MKGSVLAPTLVPVLLSAGACAVTPPPPVMPAWSAPECSPIVASAAPVVDDRGMRPTRDVELPDLWPAQGLYLGGEIITSQPLGDFEDDDLGLVSPTNDDVILVPELDVGAGIGIYLSYRWRMNELVLQLSGTEHDGESALDPRDLDTRIFNLDLNWRHYFWEHSPLQPYGLLGVGMSRAEIEDGATNMALTAEHDAELSEGININVGIGAAMYTLPWVVFYGQALYRFNVYKTADGLFEEMAIDGDVDGDSFNLSVGAAFRLSAPR